MSIRNRTIIVRPMTRRGAFIQCSSGFYQDKVNEISPPDVLKFKTIYRIENNGEYGENFLYFT